MHVYMQTGNAREHETVVDAPKAHAGGDNAAAT